MAKIQKTIKFPENRKYGKFIRRGERIIIAENAGVTPGYVREMFCGWKRMTVAVFEAAKPIIEKNKKFEKEFSNKN